MVDGQGTVEIPPPSTDTDLKTQLEAYIYVGVLAGDKNSDLTLKVSYPRCNGGCVGTGVCTEIPGSLQPQCICSSDRNFFGELLDSDCSSAGLTDGGLGSQDQSVPSWASALIVVVVIGIFLCTLGLIYRRFFQGRGGKTSKPELEMEQLTVDIPQHLTLSLPASMNLTIPSASGANDSRCNYLLSFIASRSYTFEALSSSNN